MFNKMNSSKSEDNSKGKEEKVLLLRLPLLISKSKIITWNPRTDNCLKMLNSSKLPLTIYPTNLEKLIKSFNHLDNKITPLKENLKMLAESLEPIKIKATEAFQIVDIKEFLIQLSQLIKLKLKTCKTKFVIFKMWSKSLNKSWNKRTISLANLKVNYPENQRKLPNKCMFTKEQIQQAEEVLTKKRTML